MTRQWTPEQNELIELDGAGNPKLARVAVSADAGAGKTSVLVERVKQLASDKKILCVSFTEKSKADLEQRLADFVNAEVYTIHGFCGRVVAEFGAAAGLPPFFRIMDADERNEVFYHAFEKVYRRCPPASAEHGVDRFWNVCHMATEAGPEAILRDCSGDSDQLSRFVDEVLDEFATAKRIMRALEYSDLEHCALELLRRPAVAGALRARYDHVFVDEFQDTSALQCELVDALTGREGMLFVVGDRKQSIYRFRGAQVEVFEQFMKRMPANRRLSWNFRSDPKVIAAVNATCSPIIAGYEPMQAGRLDSHAKLSAETFAGIARVARVSCETDAQGIESILQTLAARGVDPSQIVLLVRRVKGNQKLFSDLTARGISLAITSSSSASANEDLGRLLNLWIWACEPWQNLRAAQVITDFAISCRDKLDEAIRALKSPFEREDNGSYRMSCEELLRALDARFDLSARFGAIFAQFEVFVLKHQADGLSPTALARRLHRMLTNGQDVDGFVLLPPPANVGGAIRVLTVHSAKGLEFPVVILADVGRQRKRSSGLLKHGREIWMPSRGDDGDLDWSGEELTAARVLEVQAETDESARLLYVAMTRAQEALYVVDRPPNPDPEATPKTDASWSSWLSAGIERRIPAELFAGGSATAEAQAASPQAPRSSADGLRLSNEPPVYGKARFGVTEIVAQTPYSSSRRQDVPPAHDRGNARELGTEIHRHLEDESWDALTADAKTSRIDLKPFWTWFDSAEGRRVFGDTGRTYPEFAFEWHRDDVTIAGRIDRLVVFDAEAWVIDYKVLLAARTADDLLSTYAPQLRIYAEAIQRLTNIPVVRAFILDVTASTGRVWHEVQFKDAK